MKIKIHKPYKSLFAILIVASLFSQCKSQTENTRDSPIQHETPGNIPVVDSYFDGHSEVKSTTGPKTITRNVIQDKSGLFWFATWEGIVTYDGEEFTNQTNKNKLARYRAFTLLEDFEGSIWIGTVGAGLFKFDGTKFTQYTIDDGLASNTIGCLYEDKKNQLWIGTLEGVNSFDGKNFTTFKTKDGGDHDDINSIVEDSDGLLWIGTRGKLVTFDGTTFTEVLNNDQSNFYNVRSVCKTKKGKIWIGGNNGLNAYEGTTWENHSTDFTGYIFEDSNEKLWVAKSSETNMYAMELFCYEFSPMPSVFISETKILSPGAQVFGITEDKRGNIWFGLENGIASYNGETFKYFK